MMVNGPLQDGVNAFHLLPSSEPEVEIEDGGLEIGGWNWKREVGGRRLATQPVVGGGGRLCAQGVQAAVGFIYADEEDDADDVVGQAQQGCQHA